MAKSSHVLGAGGPLSVPWVGVNYKHRTFSSIVVAAADENLGGFAPCDVPWYRKRCTKNVSQKNLLLHLICKGLCLRLIGLVEGTWLNVCVA